MRLITVVLTGALAAAPVRAATEGGLGAEDLRTALLIVVVVLQAVHLGLRIFKDGFNFRKDLEGLFNRKLDATNNEVQVLKESVESKLDTATNDVKDLKETLESKVVACVQNEVDAALEAARRRRRESAPR